MKKIKMKCYDIQFFIIFALPQFAATKFNGFILMAKLYLCVAPILLWVACQNQKTKIKNTDVPPQAILSTPLNLVATKIERISDILPENKATFSEMNWNYYLQKGDFEQDSRDSGLLIVVKPDYALFVHAQENEKDELVGYNVTGFQKQNQQWVQNIHDSITSLDIFDYYKNCWRLEDINGDGYKDVLLKVYHDGKQNKNYECFLQKPTQKNFVKLHGFNKKVNPQFNVETQSLTTFSAGSKGATKKVYHWVTDSLQFSEGEHMGQTEETFYKDNE